MIYHMWKMDVLNAKHGFTKLTWFPKFFGPEPFLREQVGHGRADPKIGLRQWAGNAMLSCQLTFGATRPF